MFKATNSYLQTQVSTTTPGELLIMLYDACVKNLRQAQERMRERDVKNKGLLISKAMDIIGELQSSLNSQRGGSLALNLQKLYFFCNTRLLMANMKMDPAIIDEVIKIISGIRDAYSQIVSQQALGQVAPQTAAQAAPASPPMNNRPAAPVVRAAPAAAAAPVTARASVQVVPVAPPAAASAASVTPAAKPVLEVIPPRGPNHRAFAAYASAHKQGA
jgi:flagellar protein FliS